MKAKNILERALGKLNKEPLSRVGAVLRPPRTSPMDSLNPMMREESHEFIRVESQFLLFTGK